MHKVLGYIARGRAEGARAADRRRPRDHGGSSAKGYFVAPTVFDDCRDDMAIVREEIFGPVMSVLEFDRRGARSSSAPMPPSSGWRPACSPTI